MRALCDVPVGDRSLVIMASYEREPETQTKPRAHHVFVLNVVNLDFQPPCSLCERLRWGFLPSGPGAALRGSTSAASLSLVATTSIGLRSWQAEWF